MTHYKKNKSKNKIKDKIINKPNNIKCYNIICFCKLESCLYFQNNKRINRDHDKNQLDRRKSYYILHFFENKLN